MNAKDLNKVLIAACNKSGCPQFFPSVNLQLNTVLAEFVKELQVPQLDTVLLGLEFELQRDEVLHKTTVRGIRRYGDDVMLEEQGEYPIALLFRKESQGFLGAIFNVANPNAFELERESNMFELGQDFLGDIPKKPERVFGFRCGKAVFILALCKKEPARFVARKRTRFSHIKSDDVLVGV